MTANPDRRITGVPPGSGWFRIALFNFLVAAMIGVALRYAFVAEIPGFHFRKFMYAHSHVAMLGWLFQGFFAVLLPKLYQGEIPKTIHRYFWLSQIMVLGMLVAFPIVGYTSFAIAFAAGHILVSYGLIYVIWKELGKRRYDFLLGVLFVRTALVLMVVSTLSLWAIGPIMAFGLRQHEIFYLAVQWFLHFQFNGWFLFMALGLWFVQLESDGIPLPVQQLRTFYRWLLVSTPMTFALAVAWSNPNSMVFAVNSVGIMIQTVALALFIRFLLQARLQLTGWSRWSRRLLVLALFSFLGKLIVQALVVLPAVAEMAYTLRNYVIGFIHLITLGMLTMLILSLVLKNNMISFRNRLAPVGLAILIAGFAASEFLLFLQGTLFWMAKGFIPWYHEGLLAASIGLPLGIALFLLGVHPGRIEEHAIDQGTTVPNPSTRS